MFVCAFERESPPNVVTVDAGQWATPEGIAVGDTAQELLAAYPQATPYKATGALLVRQDGFGYQFGIDPDNSTVTYWQFDRHLGESASYGECY